MKKAFAISAVCLILVQCSAFAYKIYKPGIYHCPYYYKGKDDICKIDVDWYGKVTTECSFLDLNRIKMLLDSNKCDFESFKYYACRYPDKDYCEVGLGVRPEQYIIGCKGNKDNNKVLQDVINNKCIPIPTHIIEAKFKN